MREFNMQVKAQLRAAQWLRSRRTHLPEDKRLSRDAVTSLLIHSLFQFGASMSGVFLNLYLWRLSHSLWVNGTFSAITYIVTPLAFAAGGWLIKKKDRMVTYRIGITLIALFYFAVIFAQERLVDYYVYFAIFQGLANSFYWVGYLTLMYDVSTEQNRIRYLALNMMFFTAATLAGPALAGFIIHMQEGLRGYTIVFGIAFFMFVLVTFISLRIKAFGSHHKAYYLKFTGLLMKKNIRWLKALIGFYVLALLQGIMLFLPNILLYRVMPREDIVAYLGVLYSSLSIVMGFFLSKYAKAEQVRWYLAISTAGFILGSSFLLWNISLLTVILFMVLYSIFAPLQGNSMTGNYYGLIGKLPLKGQLRVEGVVIRELFVNVGRVTSIGIVIMFAAKLDSVLLPWILVGASLLQVLTVWMMDKD
jgi:YQGE family putative transporter